MRSIIAGFVIISLICCSAGAEELTAKKLVLSGKVFDDANKPLAGVKVTLYTFKPDPGNRDLNKPVAEEQITKEDGNFSFSAATAADGQYRYGMLLAAKDGYAIGWDNWRMEQDKATNIVLGKPHALGGVVVDEAGRPIDGAEVRVSMMFIGDPQRESKSIGSIESTDLLKTTTGANGTFAFNNIPEQAKSEFTVKKVGRATINTFKYSGNGSYNPGQYTVESKDIKIAMPVEARIAGKVLEKGTGKGVGEVRLMCVAEGGASFGGKPVVSRDDGTFSFEGLEAKTYIVMSAAIMTQKSEPAKWVIEQKKVTTAAGQATSSIILEASKGGLLEIRVQDNEAKPIAGATAYASSSTDNMRGGGSVSNSEGVAAIRLAPGEYKVQGYKQGYSYARESQTVTVEEGKTARVEIKISGNPKIRGIVHDSQGLPVAGAVLKISSSSDQKAVNSDKDGRFEIIWNPEQGSYRGTTPILLARSIKQNLAAVIEIDENTKNLDVEMTPGVIFAGKVTDPNGKAIRGAKVQVMLKTANFQMPVDDAGVTTDQYGRYEYKAIADGQQYSISAQAENYGQSWTTVSADAINGQVEIRTLALKPATMSISGAVVDVNDLPVANAQINVSGEDQQSRNGTTDRQGKFYIDKLCDGRIYVNINTRDFASGNMPMYANINTEAGATDLKIIMKSQRGIVGSDMGMKASGTLETVVTDEMKKPVSRAEVMVRGKNSDRIQQGLSDSKGMAIIKLIPGEYELYRVYKDGYLSQSERETIVIEDGKTARLEIELKAAPVISGIVRDPNGEPVARASVRIGPDSENTIISDKDGGFEIKLNPDRWGSQRPQPVLIVRHVKRNLAKAFEIEEETKTYDVNMMPGVTIAGIVADVNDKPIAGAKINLNMMVSNWGMQIDNTNITSDEQGRYEYKAIPAGQSYGVSAQAEGYGQSYVQFTTENVSNNRLEIKPMVLKVANMSISGVVVDVNDKPVANAQLNINGSGQRYQDRASNSQGRFVINKLCQGQVQVRAYVNNGPAYISGYTDAQAGDKDVKVVIGMENEGRRPVVKRIIDPAQFELAKSNLVTLQQCEKKDELEAAIDKAKAKVDEYGQGHVIVGRVVLDGDGDVRQVTAQTLILDGGYFASETKDLVRPVGFRMHGYIPYNLELKGKEGDLVDVGTIHMTALTHEQLAGITGQIVLEDRADASGALVHIMVANGPVNTPDGGTAACKNCPDSNKIEVAANGVVEAWGFSPMKYYCKATAPGYLPRKIPVELKAGQMVDFGTIRLEKPRQIVLSYIVSPEPPFDLGGLQNVTVPAGTKWCLAGDKSQGWDLEFGQNKGVITMRSQHGPCYVRDMGKGEVADYVNVSKKKVGQESPWDMKIKSEHVYLMDQQHFKHWVLFKIVIE